jgi:DNA recombination protein RmuC
MFELSYYEIIILVASLALSACLIAFRGNRQQANQKIGQLLIDMQGLQQQLDRSNQQIDELQNQLLSSQSHCVSAEKDLAVSQSESKNLRIQLAEASDKIERQQSQMEQFQEVKSQLETSLAELKMAFDKEAEHWQKKSEDYEQQKITLKKEFELLATKIFDAKQNQFSQVSQQNMESLLTPFREQVSEFRKRVDDVFHKETEQRSSLVKELKQLKELNQQMSSDAQQLTDALKGDKKMQGNWGEVVLERLLEVSGLQKGREYETQVNFTMPNGKRLMPDVLIRLPEKKTLIIDAKVSLVDYESYVAADNDMVKQKALKQHVVAIQNQVDRLSDKDYQSIPELGTLDFVIMFVPIEPAYVLAMQEAPLLFEKAFEKRVILVSPTTLLSTLRVVNNLWRYERQNENAEEIAKQAGDMLDKFVGFNQALTDVGNRIEQAQEAFATAKSRLESGRGNLISRAQRLKKLGAKVNKVLPEVLEDME